LNNRFVLTLIIAIVAVPLRKVCWKTKSPRTNEIKLKFTFLKKQQQQAGFFTLTATGFTAKLAAAVF
jgi:hypothetical protein